MLYQTYQFQDDLLAPLRDLAQFMNSGLQSFSPLPANHPLRRFAAAWELISRYKLSHERPDFAIDSVRVGNPGENLIGPEWDEAAEDQERH